MEKEVLEEYRELRREHKDLKRRMEKTIINTECDRDLEEYGKRIKAAEGTVAKRMADIEAWIGEIGKSKIRRMMRYRYIDGLGWQQVARRMGEGYTGDSCRKMHDRFMKCESVRSCPVLTDNMDL